MAVEKLPPGENPPEDIYVIIEIPMGSWVKYEVDKKTGFVFVDRILYTSMVYPFNYGFVPQTLEEDGDPVDVLVLSSDPLIPGAVIRARPVAVLHMVDEEGPDAKIVAVPHEKIDPRYRHVKDVGDIPEAVKERIKHFFEHYKELEPGKYVKVEGWAGAEEAKKRIREAIERYKAKH